MPPQAAVGGKKYLSTIMKYLIQPWLRSKSKFVSEW